MNNGKDCVLGSGPAAVACANQLIKSGRQVILIDPGRRMDASHSAIGEDFLKNPDPHNFVARLRALRHKLPQSEQTRRLPLSSKHVFEDIDRILPVDARGVTVTRTLSSGGLSSMWGATVMPFAAASFQNWPVTLEEMAPFYRDVAEIMDVPRVDDDLTQVFANFGSAAPLALSQQGAQLMGNLLNHRHYLSENGLTFGRCRSAVGNMYASSSAGCDYSGLCMYGCPNRAIFNAEYVIERLKSDKNFSYRPGWFAEGFEETSAGVSVHLRNLNNNYIESLSCERLFIACGASTSLRLVAGSLKWFDEPLYMMDTQLVSIPAFLNRRSDIGAIPQANVLGQVLAEIDDADICDELVHLQIYGYNPFVADVLRARWGVLYPGNRMLQPLFDRLMLIMAYLPGQLSAKVEMRVRFGTEKSGLPIARFSMQKNPRTKLAVQKLIKTLKKHRHAFGWHLGSLLTETHQPGASHHLAGGLPMRNAPNERESDRLGRPSGLKCVHVVDGACFPGLPGEHLTYTIMANAARIAAQAGRS